MRFPYRETVLVVENKSTAQSLFLGTLHYLKGMTKHTNVHSVFRNQRGDRL